MSLESSASALPPSHSARPIGVFDSGIGGLTVLRQLHRVLPGEDLVYLGDTARVPYGTKSPETVIRFACEDTSFLVARKVKAVVVACNTVSAWALPALEERFNVPILGVILPGAKAAIAATRNGRIGVIGTAATIRSGAYNASIAAHDREAHVFTRACPLLVPLVEEGWIEHPVTRAVLDEYLRPILANRIDALVLGCTHYPLLKKVIQECAGPDVQLVDSAESCAQDVRGTLTVLRLLKGNPSAKGKIFPFVTDEVERFEAVSERFLGVATEPPRKATLGE